MGEADEDGLVGAGGQRNTAAQHCTEERRVQASRHRCGGLVEVLRRLAAEEEAKQRADPRHHRGHHRRVERLLQPGGKPHGDRFEALVGGGVEGRERGEAGRGGQRVPRERAGLVNAAERGQVAHQLATAAEGAHRQPTADDLAETPQVGPYPVELRGPAAGQPEARDHLVEDQQRPGPVAGRPQSLEEARHGCHQAHVGGHRLHEHRRGGVVDLRHHVVGRHHRVGHRAGSHAVAAAEPLVGHAAAARRQQGVRVTVVAAGELDDLAAPGCAARQAHRGHGGLGAAGDQPDHLESGHAGAHLAGQAHFALGRGAVAGAVSGGRGNRLDQSERGVAQNAGAVAVDVVDVAIAFDVPDVGAAAPVHEVRRAAHGAECPHRRVHPAGEHLAGLLEQLSVAHRGVAGGRRTLSHRAPRPARRRSR